jgi:hypothetical protein
MADDDVSERKGPASISAPQDAFIDILNNTDKRRTKGFVVIAKGAESLQVAAFLKTARTRHGADAWDAAARERATLSFEDAIAFALRESPPQTRGRGSCHATLPPTMH